MTDALTPERLAKIGRLVLKGWCDWYYGAELLGHIRAMDARIAELEAQLAAMRTARPFEEWHEDIGDVLWWWFPTMEAPYCGTPLSRDWPDYSDATPYWTPLPPPPAPPGDGA